MKQQGRVIFDGLSTHSLSSAPRPPGKNASETRDLWVVDQKQRC